MNTTVPEAGPMLRILSRFSSGARTTAEQIPDFHHYWNARNEASLTGNDRLWIVLGDSLGQGIGASRPELGYVGQLSNHRGAGLERLAVVNLSRSGARIDDVIEDQLPQLASLGERTALITCTVGSNDLLKTALNGGLLRSYDQLFSSLPSGSLVATLPQLGSLRARQVNRRIRKALDTHDLTCADVGEALRTWRGIQAADRFHPNDDGYRVWADAFADKLDDRRPTPTAGVGQP